MTIHSVCYESTSSRHAQVGAYPNTAVWTDTQKAIPATGAAAKSIPKGLVPISGYSSMPLVNSSTEWDATADITVQAWGDQTRILQGGVEVDNTTAFHKKDIGESGYNSGRIAPRIYLDFDGATEPAGLTEFDATVTYGYLDDHYTGYAHFIEFEDSADADNGQSRLRVLLDLLVNSTANYQVGVGAAAAAIVVNYCGFAGVDPTGAVYLRPEDIGNTNPDQISTDVAENDAAGFRAHPSVFYPAGKAKYVRSLLRGARDTVGIAVDTGGTGVIGGGPLEIIQVTSAPTQSNWLVSIEGQPSIVRLIHPAGSDYRRPRDIWNNVWVPILKGSSNQSAATFFAGGTELNATAGEALHYRWQYADYFRCLPLPGTNTNQTGVG